MNTLQNAKSCLLSLKFTLLLGWVVAGAGSIGFMDDARAWVGRPATPASVAGVARRTVRRIAIGSTVYALPAGCTTVVTAGTTYHQCGVDYYRPQYQGSNVVYVVVPTP